MPLRVLTWNLMHGRAMPPAHHDLFEEFADALNAWDWDAALLQEVPPWWPAALENWIGAAHRRVLTSRNALLPVRRMVATRWPDAIKSSGGGCNAILLRRGEIVDHRTHRLCLRPERRWLHAVRVLSDGAAQGLWIGNLHATVRDTDAAVRDARTAQQTLLGWAAGEPVVLGGDFNLRHLSIRGFTYGGGADVDHVFLHGLQPTAEAQVLDRGGLSDHAPVLVSAEYVSPRKAEPAKKPGRRRRRAG